MEPIEENKNSISNNLKSYVIIDDFGMIFEQSENFPKNIAGHIKDIVDKSNKLNNINNNNDDNNNNNDDDNENEDDDDDNNNNEINNNNDEENNNIINNNINNLISINIKFKNNNIVILEDKEKKITIATKI